MAPATFFQSHGRRGMGLVSTRFERGLVHAMTWCWSADAAISLLAHERLRRHLEMRFELRPHDHQGGLRPRTGPTQFFQNCGAPKLFRFAWAHFPCVFSWWSFFRKEGPFESLRPTSIIPYSVATKGMFKRCYCVVTHGQGLGFFSHQSVQRLCFRGLLGLTSNVNAAGICSDSNGLPLYGGLDCEFRQDPRIVRLSARNRVHCATYPSKYQNGCIGTTYYDYVFVRQHPGLSQPFDGPL